MEEAPMLAKWAEQNTKQPIVLPSCAQWFSFDEIHEVELKALPEFFCGKYPSKNPQTYKEYRNYIINLYRENPNSYLSTTTCRRHLSGDVCSIMRIHAFLEHWGLINFSVNPSSKPTSNFVPKVLNYKSPLYVDASSFLVKENIPNYGNKIGNNSVILTNKSGENIRSLYPSSSIPENLFRTAFNKNSLSVLNQVNFLAKNYRPKCDICAELCGLYWHMQKGASKDESLHYMRDSLLVCDCCFEKDNFPGGLTQNNFELTNFFSVVNPNEKFNASLNERLENEKWTPEETIKLIDLIEKYGDNWEEITSHFGGSRSKSDCIVHLMQLPIKDNVVFRLSEFKAPTKNSKSDQNGEALGDHSNPLMSQVVFFAKMFDKFVQEDAGTSSREEKDFTKITNLKETIYKTYSKSVDTSKKLQKKEKRKMKKLMDMLIYLQMKKIELKLNYLNDFDKLTQMEKQQIKTQESQIIQDRIKLAIKRGELNSLTVKMKEALKSVSEGNRLTSQEDLPNLVNKGESFTIDNEEKVFQLDNLSNI